VYESLLENYGPILYCFRDKAIYWLKIAIFFIPHLHSIPTLWRTPLEFRHISYRNTRMVELPEGEKSLRICLFISKQQEWNGWTDRWTPCHGIGYSEHLWQNELKEKRIHDSIQFNWQNYIKIIYDYLWAKIHNFNAGIPLWNNCWLRDAVWKKSDFKLERRNDLKLYNNTK